MDTTLILVKTDKGVEEVKSRSFGLPQAMRALLIMADGSISMAGLLSQTSRFPNAEESIEWLVREGFVASVHPSTHQGSASSVPSFAHSQRQAASQQLPPKQALIAMTRELLGPDAAKVIQRIEDTSDSLADLGSAVERCHKFIKLTIDEAKAAQFLKMGLTLLAEFK